MYVVVAYDIVDDRRRAKVARRMEFYLTRVQKSVFEGEIPEPRYWEMVRELGDLIDHEKDRVRIYHLCAMCRRTTLVMGVATPLPRFDEDEVY